MKTLRAIAIARRGAYWRFDFDANAFLHHMVRNIMGCLVAVGSGAAPAGLARPRCSRRATATLAAPTFARRRPVLRRPVLRCRPCAFPSEPPAMRLAALRRAAGARPMNQRTRIKICGLTREADVAAAVEAGADAIGFVFYAGSPRHVSAERAAAAGARACRRS